MTSADLDPEWDYIIQKDMITKVTEVNEEGESSTDNQEECHDNNEDNEDNSDLNQEQFNQRRTSWNKSRQMKRNIDQIIDSFNKAESSRNNKQLRYNSNETSAIFSAKGK